MARKHLIHLKSSQLVNGAPKLPTSGQTTYGELSVNYAAGYETLSTLNSENEIVTFSNDTTILNYVDTQDATKEDKKIIVTVTGVSSVSSNVVYLDTDMTQEQFDEAVSANTSVRIVIPAQISHALGFGSVDYRFDQVNVEGVDYIAFQFINGKTLLTAYLNPTGEDAVEMQLRSTELGSEYSSGDGINISNNEISVRAASNSGLTVNTNGVGVKAGSGITVDSNGVNVIIDSDLDSGSTNPVENRAVFQAIDEASYVMSQAVNELNSRLNTKQDILTAGSGITISSGNVISCDVDIDVDNALDTGSTNPVENRVIYDALEEKQDVLSAGTSIDISGNVISVIIDDELDSGSTNPVQNKAVFEMIEETNLVLGSAVNVLNDRMNNLVIDGAHVYLTGYQHPANNTTDDPVDASLTVNQAFANVVSAWTDDELAIATHFANVDSGLTDLEIEVNKKANASEVYTVLEIDGFMNAMDQRKQDVLSAGTGIDITDNVISCTATIDVDDEINSGSTNPVQNKVIYDFIEESNYIVGHAINDLNVRVNAKQDALTAGEGISIDSGNVISCTDLVTVDDELDTGSTNPVENRVICDALDSKQDSMVSTTYSDLVTLKTNSNLVPGTLYRITDYVCSTSLADTSAATNQFDIIVLATSANELSERAWAATHDGSTYFSSSNLNGWQIWYCLTNDTTRFSWASSTGKGVIYRMIDEFDNECPYDFKNILFRHRLTNGQLDETNGTYQYVYTFSLYDTGTTEYKDASVFGNIYTDNSGIYHGVYGNKMKAVSTYVKSNYTIGSLNATLNDNVLLTVGSSANYKGCYGNTFELNCYNNILENEACGNKFDEACVSNYVGSGSTYNVIGSYSISNEIGNNSRFNTLGSNVQSVRFGSSSSVIGYVEGVIIENNVENVYIDCTTTPTSTSKLTNIKLISGIKGAGPNSRVTITHPTLNDTFTTTYQPTNSQVISVSI